MRRTDDVSLTLTFDLEGHHNCRSYASWYFVRVYTKCKFRSMAHTGLTYHVTLWPWPLTLEVMRVYDLHPHTNVEVLRPYHSEDMEHLVMILRLFVFDLWAIGPTRLKLITWLCDLDLWPWRSWRLRLMQVVVRHSIPSLKFVGLAIRKIWCTMCVSINGSGDLDLWPFDPETGTRVASKVMNLPSNLGTLGFWILELFAMYATDGQTDGRTKATLTAPLYGRGIITYAYIHKWLV